MTTIRRIGAEVTDAAMAGRAEYVMLNKGTYLRDAMQTIDDVLVHMRGHISMTTPTGA